MLDRMCAELYQGDRYNRRDRVQAKHSGEFDYDDLCLRAEERVDARSGIDRSKESRVRDELDMKHEIERIRNQPVRTIKRRGMEICFLEGKSVTLNGYYVTF